ncbi:hypothetical protein CMV_005702 [Castanea mollissima]|uniref:Uncharacterized protein n=1 Tax=Castanea mollissima TaxID=60419 RepID=A0A8J4RD73_9ROSI|nr:hypothetical protein CMV_005702 [Castanea mollissima]
MPGWPSNPPDFKTLNFQTSHAATDPARLPNSDPPLCRPSSPTQAPSPKPKERCTGRAMRSKHNRKPKHGEDVDKVGNIDVGLILH